MNGTLDRAARLARWALVWFAALLLAACAGGSAQVQLAGTYWNVKEVDGQSFKPLKGGRDAHLRLDEKQKRATGYSGVNSFSGSFETSAASLSFGPIAATRRAGPPPAMAFETAFFRALGETKRYRISGETLELLDAEGKARIRLEALPGL